MKNSILLFKRSLKATLVCLLLVCAMCCSFQGKVNAQTVVFNQLNFNYGGTISNNSDWGAVDLTFAGTPYVQYLNLNINGNWVIQNVPVISQGLISQTQRFWFPIGTDGVSVSGVTYDFTLTPGVLGAMPPSSFPATVRQDSILIYTGDTLLPPGGVNKPAPGVPQVGGAPVKPTQSHQNFPNQESDVNACVPTGISNSLQFLNTKDSLGMPGGNIGIDSLKKGTGWGPGGCPRPGWVDNKKNYVKSKKLPITTRKLDGPANISNLGTEIANGQDIEMDIKWKGPGAHCVCITGWASLGGGKYQISITHDKVQGKAGGTVTETATYDSTSGSWTGALAIGTNDFFFVVECPVKKVITPTPILPGGSHIKTHTGNVSVFGNGQYQIENVDIFNYSNVPPPPLGNSSTIPLTCPAFVDLSVDGGHTFQTFPCNAIANIGVMHTSDAGSSEYFDTQMLSMTLSGGGLPPGIMIRSSQTLPSTGESIIQLSGGGDQISSFFDIFTELSTDGGGSWMPESDQNSALFEAEGNTSSSIPTLSQWGLIALSLLVIGTGIFFVRRTVA